MAYEAQPGSFSLFKNDKGDNEKRPDYTGTGKDLDGQDIRVSAWLKEGAKGKFMSCRFEVAKKDAPAKKYEDKGGSVADLDSDLPF